MPSLSAVLPDLATLAPFLLASLALNLTPGADMAYVATRSVSQGASAGASQAVIHDIDLWADLNADCAPDAQGQCGEWASQSFDDNTEYLIIDNPPPGRYRLKAINWRAPSSSLPVVTTPWPSRNRSGRTPRKTTFVSAPPSVTVKRTSSP